MKVRVLMTFEDRFFITGFWRDIGSGISYRQYKHWATNVWAGEGLYTKWGDGSGCLVRGVRDVSGQMIEPMLGVCGRPYVVEARWYTNSPEHELMISAVHSYPNGIGASDEYFWEIHGHGCEELERFFGEHAEEQMEARIRELLAVSK